METTYRHIKQVPAVIGKHGSLRSHSLISTDGSGQNYMPVVVETHRHNPIQPKTGIPVSPMHRLPIRAKREMDVQGRSLSLYKSCRPAKISPAGLTSFTVGTAGGGTSRTPVGVKTPSHRPLGFHSWDSLTDGAGRLFANYHINILEKQCDRLAKN